MQAESRDLKENSHVTMIKSTKNTLYWLLEAIFYKIMMQIGTEYSRILMRNAIACEKDLFSNSIATFFYFLFIKKALYDFSYFGKRGQKLFSNTHKADFH